MKKFTTIIFSALMAAFALSSCAEKEIVSYYPENAVAPVLDDIPDPEDGSSYVLVDGETFATLTFSAVEYNVPTAARYTAYADIAENFANKKALGNVVTDTAGITISSATLNNALISLACTPDEPVTVYFRIEAEMMGESAPVATVAALVSNSVSTLVTPYNAEKVYPSIYVIGDFCGWSHATASHLFSYSEDENNYVGVVDFANADGVPSAGNGFKLTGADNWDNGNWGTGDMTSTDPEASSIVLWDDGGSGNITNYSNFRYYNFHFVKSSLTLNMIKGFNSVKVAGDFNGWTTEANTDEMTLITSNGKFYIDLDITAAGGFKFILDNGGTWIGTGDGEGKVSIGGGDNIPVEPGQYRFYLDLNDWKNPTYSLSTSDYGKEIDGGGSEDPEQPEVKENLWGIMGTFEASNWNSDIYMTEFPAGSGIWVSPALTFEAGTEFKLRYNNSWDTQAGVVNKGDTLMTGIPAEAAFGNNVAQNVAVAESQYGQRVVVYNANDNQIYLLGWSLIGAIAGDSWGLDFPMIYDAEANTWSASGVPIEGGFKLRWSGRWGDSSVTVPDRGLPKNAVLTVGTPADVIQGGDNIEVEAGTYDMVYNVADETLLLTVTE